MNLNANAFRHLIYILQGKSQVLFVDVYVSGDQKNVHWKNEKDFKVYKNEASIQVTFVRFRKMLSIINRRKIKFLLTNLWITQKRHVHVDWFSESIFKKESDLILRQVLNIHYIHFHGLMLDTDFDHL